MIFTLAAGEIQNQGGTTTINGTLAGSITYDMLNQAAANLSTTGTITAPVRFYANSMNITVPSRSFDNTVEVWTNTGTRSVTYGTAGGQTISFNSNLIVRNSDNGIFTNNFSTYNPTVNVGGDLTFTNNGGGTLPLTMGDGTWTIGGNANFSNITSFNANSSTLVMSGNSKVLTTDSRTFNNFIAENLTGSAQSIVISGTLNLNGNLNINAAGAGEANLDCATNNPAVNIIGNVDFTGVGAGSEDIHMGTNTWTVGGNIDLTGGTITAGSSTLLLNASDTGNTITSASQHFNNAQFNNASGGWSFSDAANIDGNLTVTTSETVGNGINFNNQAIDIAGNLQIDGGKLTMGNSTINLAGNWTRNGGTVVPNTSELILDSSSAQSVLSGGQSFSDLTLANTNIANGVTFTDGATATGTFTNSTQDSKTTFHAGSTYAFNAINIAGAAGHLVNFVSSAPGTAWLLNVADASPTADYVSTTDSDASLSSQINATTGGFNGGGNTNWLFAPATVTVAPASVTLDSGVDQAFTATAADAQGYNIPSATFSWAAVAGGGTITPLGVFTSGSIAGTFSNTVKATYSGASGYATVIVNGSPIPPTPPNPPTPPTPSGDTSSQDESQQIAPNNNYQTYENPETVSEEKKADTVQQTESKPIEREKSILEIIVEKVAETSKTMTRAVANSKPTQAAGIALATAAVVATSASAAVGSVGAQMALKDYWLTLSGYVGSVVSRKKKDKYGIVYDGETGKPVEKALVQLFDKNTMRLIASTITDKEGHYIFAARRGSYVISVIKPGYLFPSQNKLEIEGFSYKYKGQTIEISGAQEAINAQIPIDTVADAKSFTKRMPILNLSFLRPAILIFGTYAAVAGLVVKQSPLNFVIVAAFVLLWINELYVQHRKLKFSKVLSGADKKPIDLALVRVVSPEGKLIQTYITDYDGTVLPEIKESGQKIIIEKAGMGRGEYKQNRKGIIEGKKFKI